MHASGCRRGGSLTPPTSLPHKIMVRGQRAPATSCLWPKHCSAAKHIGHCCSPQRTHKTRKKDLSLCIPTVTAAGVVGITDLRFSLCLRYVPQMKLRAFVAMAGTGDMATVEEE
jgi:hypothetical protein